MADGRKIVGHFKHSSQAKVKLATVQEEMKKPQHNLIQEVKTRWNSTHDMAESLVEQRLVQNMIFHGYMFMYF